MSTISPANHTPQNVDPNEIQQFSSVASKWWDSKGPMRMLHAINPVRMAFILSEVQLSQQTVLDIGCGGGILTETLALEGADVTGIDLSEKAIQVAIKHSKACENAPSYHTISAEEFAKHHPNSCDVITCLEMLEHVPNPASILQACYQILKPNGQLFLSTLNRTPKSYLQAIVGAEYLFNMIPKGTHQYEKFIKPHELTQLARQNGFVLKKLCGVTYHPITKHFNLTQDVSVNYLACYQKED